MVYVNERDAGMSAAYFRQNRSAAATRRVRCGRTPACRHESRSAHPCNRWRFFAAVAKIRANAVLATGRTVADFVSGNARCRGGWLPLLYCNSAQSHSIAGTESA